MEGYWKEMTRSGKTGIKEEKDPRKNVACCSVYIFHPIVLFPRSNNNCVEALG